MHFNGSPVSALFKSYLAEELRDLQVVADNYPATVENYVEGAIKRVCTEMDGLKVEFDFLDHCFHSFVEIRCDDWTLEIPLTYCKKVKTVNMTRFLEAIVLSHARASTINPEEVEYIRALTDDITETLSSCCMCSSRIYVQEVIVDQDDRVFFIIRAHMAEAVVVFKIELPIADMRCQFYKGLNDDSRRNHSTDPKLLAD